MPDHTKKTNEQKSSEFQESQNSFTQQGKSPKEVQADLLAGEPDDLSIDFTNMIDYRGGGSN